MKVAITKTISPDIGSKFIHAGYSIDVRLKEYLNLQFSSRNYGNGVDILYAGLNCINPKMKAQPLDFETGFLIHKKYFKSKRHLEFEVKLNYSELSKITSENQLIDIIGEALLKSHAEIKALNIKDFDVDKFYFDLQILFNDHQWLKEPYIEKEFHYQLPQQKIKGNFSDNKKISEGSFWELIEKSRVESKGSLYEQIEIITEKLSKKSEKEIIGFECTLRELLLKGYHYNVMALQKIVEGGVSDDSFLYFRCKMILYGRISFEHAITNPNNLFERIDSEISGEPLLTVADDAFRVKFGEDNNKIFPREYASKVIDYDFGDYEIQGKDWEESDLPKQYSKLWKAYNK